MRDAKTDAKTDAVSASDAVVVTAPEGARVANFVKRDFLANASVVAALFLGMELWSWNAPVYIMPPIELTWRATLKILGSDGFHIFLTILRLVVAVLFALVVGSLIGAVMGMSRTLEPYVKSLVVINTGIPALSWMLFAIFWFKEPELRVFFILAMILIPFYALNVHDGIRALSTELIQMVETFRPTRGQTFRLLILPHVIPYILMTTKSIIGYATRMTVFAELVSVSTGMGARMGLAQNNFQMEGVIAWTILLVVLNLAVQGLVALAERTLLKWRPEVSVR